jgi:hypothetical protein
MQIFHRIIVLRDAIEQGDSGAQALDVFARRNNAAL